MYMCMYIRITLTIQYIYIFASELNLKVLKLTAGHEQNLPFLTGLAYLYRKIQNLLTLHRTPECNVQPQIFHRDISYTSFLIVADHQWLREFSNYFPDNLWSKSFYSFDIALYSFSKKRLINKIVIKLTT